MTTQRHAASPPRRLLDEDDDAIPSAPSSSSPRNVTSLVAFSPFGSSRHLNLHSYAADRPVDYVEVKIGGHALDHVRMLDATPDIASTRGQRRLSWDDDTEGDGWLTGSERSVCSRAFEAHATPKLEYACIKIGGHALDHVPFVGRGLPSRPLWDHVRLVLHAAAPPRRWSSNAVRQRMLQVGRVLQVDATACRRCGKMRALPRIQLCCGHALCVDCLASTTLRHVELGDGTCLIECTACGDCLAVEAVVFPNRVLCFPTPDVRSLAMMQQHMHLDGGRRYRFDWRLGTAAVALAVAARQLLYWHSSVTSALQSIDESPMLLPTLELPSTSDAASADRWHKRIESLQPPSRLLSYDFVRTLGVGNFAEVMLVKRKNGKLLVVKESDQLQEAVNEIRLLAKIRCPHVVRIHHYFVEAIGHRQFAYIEMEYCDGGDLAQWIKQHGRLEAAMFDRIFRQLCLGLSEIHRHAIVHRDIKPGNVLLTATGIAKIADFGVSTCLESNLATHHAAGTLAFMAPEVRRYFLGENVSYGLQADIWSLGALALAMLVGDPEPQIATRSVESWLAEIRRQDTPERYVTLVQQTLADDPTKRASLSTLLAKFPPMTARL